MHAATPVHVALGPSRIAGIASTFAACMLLLLILSLPIPVQPAAVLIGWVLGWLIATVVHVATRRGSRVVTDLWVTGDLHVKVRQRNGALSSGQIMSTSRVGPRLTSIVWRPTDAFWSQSVLILPDMLPGEDFRRLRVQLLHARSDASQSRPASQSGASISMPLADLVCSQSKRK